EYGHMACDPYRKEGCVQCIPTQPLVCCDIHNAIAFTFVDTPPSAASRNPARSHLMKYAMGTRELALLDALEDWRVAKAVTKLGAARVNDYGPSFILPSPTVDRIVDSAHHLKLRTIDDLRRETRWSGVGLYGAEILAIVDRIIPQPHDRPALTRMPASACPALQSRSGIQLPDGSAISSISDIKRNKCSACGLPVGKAVGSLSSDSTTIILDVPVGSYRRSVSSVMV
ncbi:hypothetical protein EDD15DRAFT_2166922, partial [Pisolithus albus]